MTDVKSFEFEEIIKKEKTYKEINSISEYLDYVLSIANVLSISGGTNTPRIAFRGISNEKYVSIPATCREIFSEGKDLLHCKEEGSYYKEFLKYYPGAFSGTSIELLADMQHNELFTRLLDYSTNPLIALYFACQEQKDKSETKGKVEIVKGTFYDEDSLEIRAIALFPEYLSKNRFDHYSKEEYINYLMEKLFPAIRVSNSAGIRIKLRERFNKLFDLDLVGVNTRYTNARIKFQEGLFMILGPGMCLADKPYTLEDKALEENDDKEYDTYGDYSNSSVNKTIKCENSKEYSNGCSIDKQLKVEQNHNKFNTEHYHNSTIKYCTKCKMKKDFIESKKKITLTVPYEMKSKLREQLNLLGVNAARIYPEFNSFARYIEEKIHKP
jgi:hypothetical protein